MTAPCYSIWRCPRCVSFEWDGARRVKRCKHGRKSRLDKGAIMDDTAIWLDNECKHWQGREK